MARDNQIPLSENEKALVGRYLKELQEMRNLLTVKGQALDDILGVLIEAKGLSTEEYVVDVRQMAIVEKGDKDVREKKEARES